MSQASAKTMAGPQLSDVISLCKSFRQELGAGGNPSIEKYLESVAPEDQPTLFRNLLDLETQIANQRGRAINVENYQKRFPEFSSIIRESFLERSLHRTKTGTQVGGLTLVPNDPNSLGSEAEPLLRLGRYKLERELGRGAMGIVYEAVGMPEGNRVALKVLPTVSGTALHLFKQEFRSVAEVNHPNLIALQALESDGSHWFFAMDLVKGVDFLKFVRPNNKLDEEKLRKALSQIVMGVLALHAKHILHRDIKPSNVMVSDDGHVVLLDFGLVMQTDDGKKNEEIAGTPLYMAPEQAAGQTVTPASDWYAVGVMLYQALSGEAPFSGEVDEVLEAKQKRNAPPLPKSDKYPQDLADFCMRLLAQKPEDRPSPLEIAKALTSQKEGSIIQSNQSLALVGREEQLALLQESYNSFLKGQGAAVTFISGRSGEGKSTLVDHFLEPIVKDKARLVLRGRCYDRESVPFKALDSLIDSLGNFLQALPEAEAIQYLPNDTRILCILFPALNRVSVLGKIPPLSTERLDEHQIRQRAITALRDLLVRLSRRSPILLFIDDLQWGDRDSAEVLMEIFQPPDPPHVLLLGTYRSDEADRSAFLKLFTSLSKTEIKVAPFSQEDCVKLMISILGKDTPTIRTRSIQFWAETGGNPLLLTELASYFDPDEDAYEKLEIKEVIRRKLERLPVEAETLLRVIAVSGQALSLEEASAAAGSKQALVATVSKMRNERLLRVINPDDEIPLVDTYHDQVRSNLLKGLAVEARQEIHFTLARIIEKNTVGDPSALFSYAEELDGKLENPSVLFRVYDLTYHFDAAGKHTEAATYAILAAERATSQVSPQAAAQHYQTAERNMARMKKSFKYKVKSGLGKVFMLLGKYEESKQRLDEASSLASDSLSKAEVEILQGELAMKKSELSESFNIFSRAIERVGLWVPKTLFSYFCAIAWETLIQVFHTYFPQYVHKKHPTKKILLQLELLFRSAYPVFFRNTIQSLFIHIKGMNLSERYFNSPHLASLYGNHSFASAVVGLHARAREYANRSIQLRQEFKDAWGLGQTKCHQGISLYAGGKYQEAITAFEDSIRLLDKAGDLWELNLAHFHKGLCHYCLGDLEAALKEAVIAFESSVRIGEDARAHCAIMLWAKATLGTLKYEDLKACYRPVPDDILSTANSLLGEAYWYIYNNQPRAAVQSLETGFGLMVRNIMVNFHTLEIPLALARALRLYADSADKTDPALAKSLRKRSFRFAYGSFLIMRFCPPHYSYAVREYATQLAQKGKLKKALKYAKRSIAIARLQKAKLEVALSQLVAARISKELGLPGAEAEMKKANQAIESIKKYTSSG